jgi:ribosome maturation factor RimP
MGVELDQIRKLVDEIVVAEGFSLVELELKGSGPERVLRIFIDKEDGVSHSDCALISEQVGTVLDVEDLIQFSYTLEVSSPGLNRKLVSRNDFVRFEGHLAKIQTESPLHNQKVFKGRLQGLQGDNIQLEMPEGELLEIPFDLIREARLEVNWGLEMMRRPRSR